MFIAKEIKCAILKATNFLENKLLLLILQIFYYIIYSIIDKWCHPHFQDFQYLPTFPSSWYRRYWNYFNSKGFDRKVHVLRNWVYYQRYMCGSFWVSLSALDGWMTSISSESMYTVFIIEDHSQKIPKLSYTL